jgi:carboxyl-terminal processing protease
VIRTSDRNGAEEISRIEVVTHKDDYAGCSISKSDIGKYRALDAVVLCNGNTASAAELFTATFRDYSLAPIVGTTTFGKGSMQSILPLAMFGCPGALKLTTKMYYPPVGDSYEGIGIVPDVVVEQSEAAENMNIYEIADTDDHQLVEALKQFHS